MNQQEFMPEPQRGRQQQEERSAQSYKAESYSQPGYSQPGYSQPYNARRTSDMPKHEQAASFEDVVPPYSYRAQDTAQRSQERTRQAGTGYTDGVAGANPRMQSQWHSTVPPWAQVPQQSANSHLVRNIIIVAIVFVFVVPLLLRLLFLLAVVGFALLAVLGSVLMGLFIICLTGYFFVRFLFKPHRHRLW
jgi:Flp pilus assembly protein TadB